MRFVLVKHCCRQVVGEGHRRQEGPLTVLPASFSLSEGGGGGVRMIKSRSLDSNAN